MDVWLLRWLNDQAGWGDWTDYVAWGMAVYGLGFLALCLAVRWFFPGARAGTRGQVRRERHTVLLAVVAAVLAVGLAQVPHLFSYRARPYVTVPGVFNLIGVPPSYSFPSIHAATAFTMATVMGWESRLWGWLTWPAAMATTWSRVFAGVHFPTDILAALVLGFLMGWALMELRPDLEPALDRVMQVLPFALGKL